MKKRKETGKISYRSSLQAHGLPFANDYNAREEHECNFEKEFPVGVDGEDGEREGGNGRDEYPLP